MTPAIVDGILYGMDDKVLDFVRDWLPRDMGPCVALGIMRNGVMIGGVVYHAYYPEAKDIEASAAFSTSAWFRPRTTRALFAYPFEQLGCERLTLRTPRKNKAARRFAEHAGFKLEGVRRRAHDGRQDQMIYGLLKSECRYLGKDC